MRLRLKAYVGNAEAEIGMVLTATVTAIYKVRFFHVGFHKGHKAASLCPRGEDDDNSQDISRMYALNSRTNAITSNFQLTPLR